MSNFNYQKTEVLNYYDKTNAIFKKHQKMFGQLISKLNENNTYYKQVVTNLDDFMSNSFEDLKTFSKSIENQKLNCSQIEYIFDLNKKDYIDTSGFNLDDRLIVKNFTYKLKSGQLYSSANNSWNISSVKLNNFYGVSNIDKLAFYQSDNSTNNCHFRGSNHCININPRNNQTYFTENDSFQLNFQIDNYLNIYVPILKTYFMSNYNSFPNYSFFINSKKLEIFQENDNPNNVILFNVNNKFEAEEYNNLRTFINESNNYLTSHDKRILFKEKYHQYLFNFYRYNDKVEYFEQFLKLSENFVNILPIESNKILVDSEGDSIDTEQKIFLQSNRIQELNIKLTKQEEELEYLRRERNNLIEFNNNKEIEINSRNKLISELNDNLKSKISEFSKLERENIILKTRLLKVEELDVKNNKLKNRLESSLCTIQDVKTQINEKELVNETLMDNQLELNEKIDSLNKDKQQLNYNLTEYHVKVKNLEDQIKNLKIKCETKEKEIILTQNRLDTVIQQLKKDEQDNLSKNSEYQQILLKQIKEKTDLLKNADDKIKRFEGLYDKVRKDYNDYKLRVAKLVE